MVVVVVVVVVVVASTRDAWMHISNVSFQVHEASSLHCLLFFNVLQPDTIGAKSETQFSKVSSHRHVSNCAHFLLFVCRSHSLMMDKWEGLRDGLVVGLVVGAFVGLDVTRECEDVQIPSIHLHES